MHNLPSPTTSFVGRQSELVEITRLLHDPACRLLTLLGPGGIGKTRLAIEAAYQETDSFADGVCFVPLTSISAAELLVTTLAERIGFFPFGQVSPREQFLDHLRDKEMLLVLDSFEHLLAASDLLVDVLEAAPWIKFLVISREVLNLREEWIRTIEGLPYPPGETDAASYPAVQLFAERAHQVQASFSLSENLSHVMRICRLVEGMPLGIELAAAWLRTLPCAVITNEMQRRLDFLSTTLRNVPERHRSIRAVFDQSWQMLSPQEQTVFKKLSVFQGSFSREAAEWVTEASLETLSTLVSKSLLRVDATGRFDLHDLLRQYADEHLQSEGDEWAQTHDRHCATFTGLLHRLEPDLKSAGQVAALATIDQEIDNIRAAWDWAVDRGKEVDIQQSIDSLALYYQIRSYMQEGAKAFGSAAEQFKTTRLWGPLITLLGWFEWFDGNLEQARPLLRAGRDWILQHGADGIVPMTLHLLPAANATHDEIQEAFQRCMAYFQSRGDRWGAAWVLYSQNAKAVWEDPRQPRPGLVQSLAEFEALGDGWSSTWAMHTLGLQAHENGHHAEAEQFLLRAIPINRKVGDRAGITFALMKLGETAMAQRDFKLARHYYYEALQIGEPYNRFLKLSDPQGLARFKKYISELLSGEGSESPDQNLLSVAGVYRLMIDEEDNELLAELLWFLRSHTDSQRWQMRIVGRWLEMLEAELPPSVFAAARRRGESSSLEQMLARLNERLIGVSDGALPQVGRADQRSAIDQLSDRELEVLRLVADGYSNREIAERLVVSTGTVKKHLNNIFGKLQVRSRTQAAARAKQLNLLP